MNSKQSHYQKYYQKVNTIDWIFPRCGTSLQKACIHDAKWSLHFNIGKWFMARHLRKGTVTLFTSSHQALPWQGCCSSHQSIIYLRMTQTGEVKTHPISHAVPSKSLKFQKDCVYNSNLSQWFKKLSLLLCSMSTITWLRLATEKHFL